MLIKIPLKNIFVPDNGQVVELSVARDQVKIDDKASFGVVKIKDPKTGKDVLINGELLKEKVDTDYVMVDGLGVGDVSNIVLRDRRVMAEDGMIVVIATIDSKTGAIIGNPDIISRGFVYMKENRELIETTRMKVKNLVREHNSMSRADDDLIKNKIRNEVGQFLFSKTKRRPMVLPVVIKV